MVLLDVAGMSWRVELRGAQPLLLKLWIFWGDLATCIKHVLGLSMYLRRKESRRYTTINRRRMLQPYPDLLFRLYFHMYSSSNQIVARISKMGVAKGVVNIFLTIQPSFLQFLDSTTEI